MMRLAYRALTITALPPQSAQSTSVNSAAYTAGNALPPVSYSNAFTVTTPTTAWSAPTFTPPATQPCYDGMCPAADGQTCFDSTGTVYGILCDVRFSGGINTNSGKARRQELNGSEDQDQETIDPEGEEITESGADDLDKVNADDAADGSVDEPGDSAVNEPANDYGSEPGDRPGDEGSADTGDQPDEPVDKPEDPLNGPVEGSGEEPGDESVNDLIDYVTGYGHGYANGFRDSGSWIGPGVDTGAGFKKRGYTGSLDACIAMCDDFNGNICIGVGFSRGRCTMFNAATGSFEQTGAIGLLRQPS